MSTSLSLMFNLSNKESVLSLTGIKNKIESLTETPSLEMPFIKADLVLNLLMFQEMFTTNKMWLDPLSTKREYKSNSNKDLLEKPETKQLFSLLNTLVLKLFRETLFLIKLEMKFLLVYLNQSFMTFLYTIMSMFPLKNLAILVVVGIKTEMVLLRLLILPKLKFSETEEKSCLAKEVIEETIKKDKLSLRKKTLKMLLIITASFTEERLSLEIQGSPGGLLKTLMTMLMDTVRNLENMLN